MEQRQDSLVGRLKAGNHQAADELVDTYYQRIFWFMRRFGCDRQVSEDLTQECFLQAWQHISQLRNANDLNSWLYRIAGNVFRLYRRRNNNKETDGLNIILATAGDDEKNCPEYNEQFIRLEALVGQLPLKLKEAVVLHYLQQLTIAEAALAAGIRKGTFKSRLNRALKMLKKRVVL